jgi:hypothetical protein
MSKTRALSGGLFVGLFLAGLGGVQGSQDPALEPGLVAEYFEMNAALGDFPSLSPDRKPTYVRVEKQVDYDDVTGDFYGTRMIQNFYARWTGVLRVAKAGRYELFSASDDGSRVFVDGKKVVENGGTHPMTERSGAVELSPGDHELKIEFFQGGGEAGIKVAWQPPGAGRTALPAAVLFHRKGSEKLDFDQAAWNKRPQAKLQKQGARGTGKYAEIDRGLLACGTIDGLYGSRGNFANKGFALLLNREKQAHVCFDSELLKVTAAWTGGAVGWPSGRDGLEGQPFAEGTIKFGTQKNTLGWAKDASFKDPRVGEHGKPLPYGPLPRDWGRYKGIYFSGDRSVLAYSVGDCEVLESPGFEVKGEQEIFTRTFNLKTSGSPLLMLVVDQAGGTGQASGRLATLERGEEAIAVGLLGGPEGGALAVAGTSRIELKLPALPQGARFGLALWSGPKADVSKFSDQLRYLAPPADLTPLTKGGPGRNTPVTTVGVLGKEAGAYQVDTLTVPYENPPKSYMRLTGVDFFSDGRRAAVCTMDGDVWIVSGIDDKLEKLTWKRFASGLFQTLGLRIVNDEVYTLGRDQITRLRDLNGDGEADFYECFNNECGVTPSYHEFTHDLHTDSQGNFYYAKGSNLGNAVVPYHGALIKVAKDGKSSEVWTTGFRAPNGFSVGPGDIITTSDNQGNWTPSTPINWVDQKGLFCGFVPCSHTPTPPKERPLAMCWIPYDQDNSGAGQIWATSDAWGPFKNHLFHLSYGKCVVFHVMYEKVGDLMQAAVFKFPFKFQSGSMRGRMNPVDGQMYLVGMKGWQTDAARDGCFQRIRYTGKPANMPLEAHVTSSGLSLTFTDKVDPESAGDVDRYTASWCNLRWTADYGSPEFWVSEPNRKGREPLPIQAVSAGSDGKTVNLKIPGLKPVHHLVLKYKIKGADGTAMNQEVDFTINRVP